MLSFCTCTEQERASGRSLSQVLVAADPLAVVAAQGQAMWDPVGWTAGRGAVRGAIRRGCGRLRGGALCAARFLPDRSARAARAARGHRGRRARSRLTGLVV